MNNKYYFLKEMNIITLIHRKCSTCHHFGNRIHLDGKIQKDINSNDFLTDDDQTFDCLYCDRDFRTEKGRLIHMSKSHKKEYSNSRVSEFFSKMFIFSQIFMFYIYFLVSKKNSFYCFCSVDA